MITTDTVQKTLSDYEQLPEGSSYELIAGGLIQEPAPVPYHQLIALELSFAILTYIKRRNNNPGRLYIAPVDVVLSGYDVVQPDLVFIASGSVAVVGSKRIEGPPDLVVEILSPSNASTDLWDKRLLYERTGVREYWIVDPERRRVEAYENREGTFVRFSAAEGRGKVFSNVLNGFELEITEVF